MFGRSGEKRIKNRSIKNIIAVIILLLLVIFQNRKAFADMGPKEAMQINISGIEGEYYVAILAEHGSGPCSVITADEAYTDELKILTLYEDEDGYKCMENYWCCKSEAQFDWTYFPPDEFKILIYDVTTEKFIVSEVCERYSFNSYFYVTVEADEIVELETGSAIFNTFTISKITDFVARMIATIVIELIIAKLFGYKRKEASKIIIISNVITQLFLNLFLFAAHPVFVVFFYAILEIMVFIIESVIYSIKLYKYDEKKSDGIKGRLNVCLYALVANLCSFAIGVLLYYIGAMFAYSQI